MTGFCELKGCIYNDDGVCEYEFAPWQDPYFRACYDETDEIYDELIMEEW